MADQVNPLGGLVPGMAHSLQSLAVQPQPNSAPTRSEEPRPKAGKDRGEGVSKESLGAAARRVEGFLQQMPADLKFLVDEATGMYYFKIVNPATGETIRQVPEEEILEMARRLRTLGDPKGTPGMLMDAEG